MEAGRELDALVAEHVKGFKHEKAPKDYDGMNGGTDILVPPDVDHANYPYPPKGPLRLTFFVPAYSADLGACHELMGWMIASSHAEAFVKELLRLTVPPGDFDTPEAVLHLLRRLSPRKVCLAALAAVGHPLPQERNG